MEAILNDIAQKLADIAKKREILSGCLQETDKLFVTAFKSRTVQHNLKKLKIVGVDGGFLKKEYHGAGMILRRAVAVCFEFEDGKLKSTEYHPGPKPIPEPIVVGPEFSESDFNQLAGLKREELELQICIGAIEKFKPDIVIRDGSIVLYPSNMPGVNSPIYKTYESVVSLFKKLYETCENAGVLLCGAVEDSRGKRYCKILLDEAIPAVLDADIPDELAAKISANKDVLLNTTDTLFLYYFLGTGEKTEAVDYSKSSELPVLKDLEEFSKKIFAFYIKAVEFDRPLRIDFLSNPEKLSETADKISSIIYTISKQNRTYAYPSVLIEADARAKLTEVEIAHFKAALNEKLGKNPTLFDLRRELRPF